MWLPRGVGRCNVVELVYLLKKHQTRDLTANRLAINLRVPAARIGEIVNGRRAITADTPPVVTVL